MQGPPPSPPADAPPRVLRLDLAYDGTAFAGWQRQAAARSVQGEVERALERILGGPHAVLGCGRTDAGVHARRFVASVRTHAALPAARIARALDALLPSDVGVRAVRDAAPGFHALRDALWKWYRYRVVVAPRRRPLEERWAWRRRAAPALEALAAAAAPLAGRHDMASFGNTGSPREHTVRTLHHAGWGRRGRQLWFDVVGDGFLYKMVRTLVGTQWQAAREAAPGAAVAAVLAARDRRAAGPAVPAHGLMLMAVGYAGDPPPRLPSGPVRTA